VVPTDRQLVDSLLALILSMSQLTELILDDEIERVSQCDVVNVAQLNSLAKAKREFHLRALIMEYVLKTAY
jgi:hypothetical protein